MELINVTHSSVVVRLDLSAADIVKDMTVINIVLRQIVAVLTQEMEWEGVPPCNVSLNCFCVMYGGNSITLLTVALKVSR